MAIGIVWIPSNRADVIAIITIYKVADKNKGNKGKIIIGNTVR